MVFVLDGGMALGLIERIFCWVLEDVFVCLLEVD